MTGVARKTASRFALAVTVLYLLLEFALNARILEMMDGNVTVDELEQVEVFGRCLFAFAICLALWRLLPSAKRRFAALIALVAVLGPLAYLGQQSFVEHLVERLGPEQRRNAHFAIVISDFIRDGEVRLSGVPFTGEDWLTADGAVFLALLPSLSAFSEDFQLAIEEGLAQALRNNFERTAIVEAQRSWAAIQGLQETLRDHYSDYSRNVVLDQRRATAEQGWTAFQERLGRIGVVPLRATSREKRLARQWLRNNELRVSDRFQLYDREAFHTAWQERAERYGYAQTEASAAEALPRGLSFEEFLRHPTVASRMEKEVLEAGFPKGSDLAELTATAERASYLQQSRDRAMVGVERSVEDLLRPEIDYARGGPRYAEGESAARFMVVPPIALGFSMAGAFANLASLLISAFLAIRVWAGWRGAAVMAVLTFTLLFAPYLRPNALVRAQPYQEMITSLRAQANPALVTAIDWTVRLEPTAFAIGDSILDSVRVFAPDDE